MTSTAGRLLLAEPMLGDPNFDRTVLLMIEHTAEGAMGLVLNRPTDLAVGDALPGWGGLATEPAVLHVGGPVEERSAWCLARLATGVARAGFVRVLGEVGLLDLDLELDPDDVAADVTALRLYAGYSGWGPGQLEDELSQEAWIVVDANCDDPFLPDGQELWQRILARQGGHLARLSFFPRDPSLNRTAVTQRLRSGGCATGCLGAGASWRCWPRCWSSALGARTTGAATHPPVPPIPRRSPRAPRDQTHRASRGRRARPTTAAAGRQAPRETGNRARLERRPPRPRPRGL